MRAIHTLIPIFTLLCAASLSASGVTPAVDLPAAVAASPAPGLDLQPATPPEALPEAPLPDPSTPPAAIAPLTLGQKLTLTAHRAFGPPAFAIPAVEAGIDMAHPPNNYPHEWRDGANGFGRLYGAYFSRHTANFTAQFLAGAILHEDPRYFPSSSTNPAARLIHAVGFTLIDRTDGGHRTLAVSNFAGSAAAGFVGMAYQPDGFNDVTHAYQRASIDLAVFLGQNILTEFRPEIARILHRRHVSNAPESAAEISAESFPVWW